VSDGALDLVVTVEKAEPEPRAADLAGRLRVPLVTPAEAVEADLRLVFTAERLELCSRGMRTGTGIAADFSNLTVRRLTKRHPLARAVGRDTRTVLDATAGLGQDAFLLAHLGYEVTAVERSPVIAALLGDGLRRAGVAGVRLIEADARLLLQELRPLPDAISIDPMFPPKRRESALPRKEIQLIRRVAGDDPDAAELLEAALRSGAKRIIVKRPHHAPPLARRPHATIESKLVRYDLYLQPLAA
jgi:16S rRNA (guanine1516-N2)-methyltransferase